ncbi:MULTISPECIES: hypothetical protein [unclassified Pseudoalteromonas]|uniref:hypothetical protein n=1 Tax=unclassified Pseudoalteromonas TaxID=194690 RepID=UPI00140A001A|nr:MULTISPECIES: hypothetical protein [unclassified Pseudoalteromonas]MBH0028182.1 hypothetical protein [Pseudoalteromonas sp. SWN29]
MDNLHFPLTEILKAAPLGAIPKQHHAAYKLLKALANVYPHNRDELAINTGLGETLRSALQRLRGESGGYWLIHSRKIEGSNKTLLQLDPRHLTGDKEQDRAARRERRKELGIESYKQAVQGRKREPKAFTEMTVANKEYFKSLGGAANDSIFEKEKPNKG